MKEIHKTKRELPGELVKLGQQITELEKSETEYKKTKKTLENEISILEIIFENLPVLAYKIGLDGKVLDCNRQAVKTLGYKSKKELIGRSLITTIYEPSSQEKAKRLFLKWKKTGSVRDEELQIVTKLGKIRDVLVNVNIIHDINGKPLHSISIQVDNTERKRVRIRLKEHESELEKQKLVLAEKNIALRELIEIIEMERRRIHDDIEANINVLIFPILKKLKLKSDNDENIDIVHNILKSLTSSFGTKITEKRLNLTPKEIEICNMVKETLSNKEISRILNISSQTVVKHRHNIRRKLGISNRSINLTSFLREI